MVASSWPAMTHEQARLHELYGLQILDTPAEERFDQYTRLVADVLGVPTVWITLVDAQRQWFKSIVGLDVSQTGREDSFCAHALPVGFLEIPDARKDARFSNNAVVTGAPFIRFYAGAVLHGPTGQPLGTLCVIDYAPRHLSAVEKTRLIAFAGLVEQEINLHQRFHTLESQLQRAAFYEPVTGLPGPGLMEAHLTRGVDETRAKSHGLTVVHIQLTNFETLMSLEGQRGVDAIMQILATRLRQSVRPTDQIGRLGSDRFLLILPSLNESELTADERLRKLFQHVGAPVQVGATSRPVKLAAGASCYPDDATTASGLLDCARTALLHTSGIAGTLFNFYSHAAHDRTAQHHDKVHRLSEALQANRLHQVYQPIVDCRSGQMVGVEALARWRDDAYGDVSLSEFIPLIEADTDMRRSLTRWSLAAACRQIVEWRRQQPCPLSVSVNISGGELYQKDFVDLVRATLSQYDVSPGHLVLELTEESLIADMDAAVATIKSLRLFGVRFALDDFGTGYSSLNYLKQLPLDTLKIDRSFIRDMVSDTTTHELIRGILDIARTLRLSVVAEGIETEDQHVALQQMACTYAQGFLFSRPVTGDAIVEQLRVAWVF